MRTIGFYQGTDHALPGAPDIRTLSNKLDRSSADRVVIVHYLNSAPVAVRSLGTVSHDVLDQSKSEIGPHEILTDGVWAWPNDLGYYVEKYDIGIDEEFIDHILTAKEPPGEVSGEVIRDVEHSLFG